VNEKKTITEDADYWKALAVRAWVEASLTHTDEDLREAGPRRYGALIEIENMKATVSWRLTKPLRVVRGLMR
jgi:hypothetical protein